MITQTDLSQGSQPVSYNVTGLPFYSNTERLLAFPKEKRRIHWHEEVEMIHVLEGTMGYLINETSIQLYSGDFLFINARQMHRRYSIGGRDCRYNILQVDPAFFNDSLIVRNLLEPVFKDELFSFLFLPKGSEKAGQFAAGIDRIISEKYCMDFGYELEVIQQVFSLFRLLFSFYTFEDEIHYEDEDEERRHFQTMVAFIYGHYHEKLRVDDIAASAHVCRSKCCRLFRRFTGTSPNEFLNDYRMGQSAKLLIGTNKPAVRIAQECGFSQQSYFNKKFLEAFGCTPIEYRKRTQPRAPYRGRHY